MRRLAIEFSKSLIKELQKANPYALMHSFSYLEEPDFDYDKCFVGLPPQKRAWITDSTYGPIGGYFQKEREKTQCIWGEDDGVWDVKNLFDYYGQFQICRRHANMLPDFLKPVWLLNEKAHKKHVKIVNFAWNSLGACLEDFINKDFREAVKKGERMS